MSAAVTKSDIAGSSLTISYRDFNKDAATRRFFVTAAASDDKEVVIAAVRAAAGTHHDELTTLPLQTITATRIGIGTWLVIGRYDRSMSTGLPIAANLLVDVATAFESMNIYTDETNFQDGVPFGGVLCPITSLNDQSKKSDVERKVWQRPVVRLKWPFNSGTHPIISYRNAAGTTNKVAMSLGGGSGILPIQSVRYDGFVCNTKATTDYGAWYFGYHNLTYSPSGSWLGQTLYWDGSQHAVRLDPTYSTGSWVLA